MVAEEEWFSSLSMSMIVEAQRRWTFEYDDGCLVIDGGNVEYDDDDDDELL